MLLLIIMKINFFRFSSFFFFTKQKTHFCTSNMFFAFTTLHPRQKTNHQSITLLRFTGNQKKTVSFNYRIILKIINLHLRRGSCGNKRKKFSHLKITQNYAPSDLFLSAIAVNPDEKPSWL